MDAAPAEKGRFPEPPPSPLPGPSPPTIPAVDAGPSFFDGAPSTGRPIAAPAARSGGSEERPVLLNDLYSEMREAGVEHVVGTLLEQFLVESPPRLGELASASAAGDLAGASASAHALKSAAGTIRAIELASLLSEAERAGKEGDGPAVAGLVERIQTEYRRVAEYLEKEMGAS
jgi:HPt (histidine-containing phosphotransfer) domain-containing protein